MMPNTKKNMMLNTEIHSSKTLVKKKKVRKLVTKAETIKVMEIAKVVVTPPVVEVPKTPEIITVTEFFARFAPGNGKSIHVRFPDTNVPKIMGERNRLIAHPYVLESAEALITSTTYYGVNQNYIGYTNVKGLTFSAYFPDDFKMIVLEGEGKEEFIKRWEENQMLNLHNSLPHSWMIGCQPEIFVEDENGKCIPSFLFLPEKEKSAKTLGGTSDTSDNNFGFRGGMPMYWNGFQSEFVTQSQNCLGYHIDSIAAGFAGVYKAAKDKFPKAKLSIRSVMDIPPEMLTIAESKHVELNAASDNVYGLKLNQLSARELPFRAAGSSIYFGIAKLTVEQATPIVKALDAILGVACVSLFAEFDDVRFRTLRLPGEYKLSSGGLDYCSLSNAWLCHSMITNLVMDFSRKVVILGQKNLSKYWITTEEEVISCIMERDVKKAHLIMDRNKELMFKLFRAAYTWAADQKTQEAIYGIFYNGMQTAVKDPTDFVKNWTLDGRWHTHSDGKNKNVFHSYQELMASKDFRVA